MSPRRTIVRETRAAAGFSLGAVSASLGYGYHDSVLVAGVALVSAGFLIGAALALRGRPAARCS